MNQTTAMLKTATLNDAALVSNPSINSLSFLQGVIHLFQNILRNSFRLFFDAKRDYTILAEQTQQFARDVSQQFQSVHGTLKSTSRFKKIVGVGLKVISSYRVFLLKKEFLPEAVAAEKMAEIHKINAQRLHDLCAELRGGVLKLGQFISCRMDLLPPAYIDALSALQDNVPAIPTEIIVQRIETELGRPLAEVFQFFDEQPLAAASLAQVHKAVLLTGEAVAVKVQVPGVRETVEVDLNAAQSLTKMFKDLVPQIDMATILTELKRSVREELDYRIEAENMARFRAQLSLESPVIVPALFNEFCTDKILVMELIEGEKLTTFCDRVIQQEDASGVDRVLETLMDSFCAQIITHGAFHADPHPGNFLVTANQQLAILDFGSVRVFDESERAAYANLTSAILLQDRNKMAELLKSMHFKTREDNPDTLFEFADVFLGVFRENIGSDISLIDPKQQMAQLMRVLQQNPVVNVPGNFVMLGRVFAYLGGLLFFYKPKINLFGVIAPYVVFSE